MLYFSVHLVCHHCGAFTGYLRAFAGLAEVSVGLPRRYRCSPATSVQGMAAGLQNFIGTEVPLMMGG